MKSRFTDEQIIAMIKEQESGEKTADVCRRHGISSATFYKYKSKYGGMEPSDAKRLRALEDENGKLKKLLAEQMLDNAMLRDINSPTVTLGWLQLLSEKSAVTSCFTNRPYCTSKGLSNPSSARKAVIASSVLLLPINPFTGSRTRSASITSKIIPRNTGTLYSTLRNR